MAETIQAADAALSEDTLTEVARLKVETGRLLTQLGEKLEAELAAYRKVREAVECKNRELGEVFDIEKSAYALAALIEAQRQKKADFEVEMANRKETLDEEILATRSAWEKEKKLYQEQLKERDAEDKRLRQRQQEEYNYAFKREQELAKNALQDQLQALEKEMASKRETFERTVTTKEQELSEREARLLERERTQSELEAKVAAFPKELETQVAKAVKETTDRLKADQAKSEALLKKEAEGEVNVLKAKITALESTVADQAKQLTATGSQLENAYGKVQAIAMKAIEGSANMQTLAGVEQLIEKSKRSPSESK